MRHRHLKTVFSHLKDQCLTVVSGNLRCDACKETISKKKSSVKKHVASAKHIKALENIKKSKMKDQNIKDLLAKTSGKAKGSTLPEDMRLYRYELVEALLKAGIPLLTFSGHFLKNMAIA